MLVLVARQAGSHAATYTQLLRHHTHTRARAPGRSSSAEVTARSSLVLLQVLLVAIIRRRRQCRCRGGHAGRWWRPWRISTICHRWRSACRAAASHTTGSSRDGISLQQHVSERVRARVRAAGSGSAWAGRAGSHRAPRPTTSGCWAQHTLPGQRCCERRCKVTAASRGDWRHRCCCCGRWWRRSSGSSKRVLAEGRSGGSPTAACAVAAGACAWPTIYSKRHGWCGLCGRLLRRRRCGRGRSKRDPAVKHAVTTVGRELQQVRGSHPRNARRRRGSSGRSRRRDWWRLRWRQALQQRGDCRRRRGRVEHAADASASARNTKHILMFMAVRRRHSAPTAPGRPAPTGIRHRQAQCSCNGCRSGSSLGTLAGWRRVATGMATGVTAQRFAQRSDKHVETTLTARAAAAASCSGTVAGGSSRRSDARATAPARQRRRQRPVRSSGLVAAATVIGGIACDGLTLAAAAGSAVQGCSSSSRSSNRGGCTRTSNSTRSRPPNR